MNLTKFTPENCFNRRDTRRQISVYKSGQIVLQSRLVQDMKLKAGMKIVIASDEDYKDEWYIFRDKEGFTLREDPRGIAKYLMFNCSSLAQRIRQARGVDEGKLMRFLVGSEPMVHGQIQYWPIIMASCDVS